MPDDAVQTYQYGWTTNPRDWFALSFRTEVGSAETVASYYVQAMSDDGWQMRRGDGFARADDGRLIYVWVSSSHVRPVTLVIFQEAEHVAISLNAQCLRDRCPPVVDITPTELRG